MLQQPFLPTSQPPGSSSSCGCAVEGRWAGRHHGLPTSKSLRLLPDSNVIQSATNT
jgi:hypothetical protein